MPGSASAEAEARLNDLPELKVILSVIGKVEGLFGQASEGVYLAQTTLKFSERTEREITLAELISGGATTARRPARRHRDGRCADADRWAVC